MSIEIFILLISYFFIIFSIIGFGNFFLNLFKFQNDNFCLGYKGIIGIFFLIIYSYISNYFYPHTLTHNFIVLLTGFILCLVLLKKLKKEEVVKLIIIFSIIFIGLLSHKTHDDFPYYHFPYIYNLTQNSAIFGIGKLNYGFRTPSSIFYLNSLFYLPVIKYFTFTIGAALILGFSNLIFFKIILEKLKTKKNDLIFYFSLSSFIFVNIFFYRLQEHGTDRSAMILIFLLFINIFLFFINYTKKNIQDIITKIAILVSLIISFKAFYILYLIFIIPVIFYIIKKKNFSLIKSILSNIFLYSSFVLILLVLVSYFINTGCFLYPIAITCFESVNWTLPMSSVKELSEWYQIWSKGGATPNFRIENPSEYIKGFNWVQNWLDIYFFNKVSDFLLGLIFLTSVLLVTFNKINNNQKNLEFLKSETYSQIKIIYFFILLLFFEWFYNHPALRYGGYIIIALIFFIPLSNYLARLNYDKKVYYKTYFLIFLTLSIFSLRNIHRISKEINMYSYKPFVKPYYFVDDYHFRIDKQIDKIFKIKN